MDDVKTGEEKREEKIVLAGQEEPTGARADFVSSVVLMAFGLVTIVESFRMPLFESWGSYARPGFPPAFFGVMLILCSALVFFRSLKRGGHRLGLTAAGFSAFLRADATRRFAFVIFMVCVYYLLMEYLTDVGTFLGVSGLLAAFHEDADGGLARGVNYALPLGGFFDSTFVFLLAMMTRFKAGTRLRCLIYSFVVAYGAWFLFERIFLVPLP